MKKPRVCVIRFDGTNCDREAAHAFNQVGAHAEIVHINSLRHHYNPVFGQSRLSASPVDILRLGDYHILAIPGGFSKGDYVNAGVIASQELKQYLGDEISKFIDDGKLIIGICNGFQILVKAGLLPMFDGQKEQTVTLTYNDSQRFECRWTRLKAAEGNSCVWTNGISTIELPVAHGEGKFYAAPDTLRRLFDNGQVVYQYVDQDGNPAKEVPDNPNGSLEAIAGICDPSGRIFGLMPHPERYNTPLNHPLASLQRILERSYVDKDNPAIAERLRLAGSLPKEGAGLQILKNGVDYAAQHLM